MDGRLLGSVRMNIHPLNGLNDGLFFQFIHRMVFWSGISGKAHIRWSYSMISCVIKSFLFVRLIQGPDQFSSWITRQSITVRYRNPLFYRI